MESNITRAKVGVVNGMGPGFWLFALLTLIHSDGLGGANLAVNPSAESIDKDRRPIGWGHYKNTPAEWGTTTKEFCEGKRCGILKIKRFGDDGYACTGASVGERDGYSAPNRIAPGPLTTYHFFPSVIDATEEAILNSILKAEALVGVGGRVREAIAIEKGTESRTRRRVRKSLVMTFNRDGSGTVPGGEIWS